MSSQQSGLLVGNDALNKLIEIYMNGFVTGASSALATFTSADDARTDKLVDYLAEALRVDPLAVEAVRREIAETLAGIDTGEKTFNVAPPAGEQP